MRGKDSYFVYLLFENYGKIYCDNNYSLEYCFMRNRLNQFMAGRYGNDPLNRFLSIVVLVLIVINFILSRWLPPLLTTLIFLAVTDRSYNGVCSYAVQEFPQAAK